jgi:hypothetical protein
MEVRAAIRAFRDRLVGHYMHRHPGELSDAEDELGGLAAAINKLDDGPSRCLPPFVVKPLNSVQKFIVRWRLGDPLATDDAWRPWVRNRHVENALAELAARWKVDRKDVIAFGDMPNDIAMLVWAGTSYAMAAAHPTVVEAATHLAPSNDDDSVARVLASVFGLAPAAVVE